MPLKLPLEGENLLIGDGDAELGLVLKARNWSFFFENWIARFNLLGEGVCLSPGAKKGFFREKRFHLSNVSSDDACGHY